MHYWPRATEAARTLAMMLEQAGVPYLAIDRSVDRIRSGKEAGHHVYYGDMTDPQIIEAAGVGKDNKRKLWSAIKQIKYNFRYMHFLSCCFLCGSWTRGGAIEG